MLHDTPERPPQRVRTITPLQAESIAQAHQILEDLHAMLTEAWNDEATHTICVPIQELDNGVVLLQKRAERLLGGEG